jgi:hypothetical protein
MSFESNLMSNKVLIASWAGLHILVSGITRSELQPHRRLTLTSLVERNKM